MHTEGSNRIYGLTCEACWVCEGVSHPPPRTKCRMCSCQCSLLAIASLVCIFLVGPLGQLAGLHGTSLMDTLHIVVHKLKSYYGVAYVWPNTSSFVHHHSNQSASSNLPTTIMSLTHQFLTAQFGMPGEWSVDLTQTPSKPPTSNSN
jgi:hypothetical protein